VVGIAYSLSPIVRDDIDFLKRHAPVIPKVEREIVKESKIMLKTTKVPHMRKGRFLDDIESKIVLGKRRALTCRRTGFGITS
jgi:hypothetical protein